MSNETRADAGTATVKWSDGTEFRSIPAEVRMEADGAVLRGEAVRFGSLSGDLGGFREEFAAGAFDEGMDGDLRVLWQHDSRYVFGRTSAGTARFRSDLDALRYEADPPNAQWARDAMESIRRGDVTQSSFAFRVRDGGETWVRREGELVRIVTSAQLLEAGPQTFPAYEDTAVAVRSMKAHLAAAAPQEPEDRSAVDERLRWKVRIAEIEGA